MENKLAELMGRRSALSSRLVPLSQEKNRLNDIIISRLESGEDYKEELISRCEIAAKISVLREELNPIKDEIKRLLEDVAA
jgi:seryl-tRNA synthetase